jgi:hypothetical protein
MISVILILILRLYDEFDVMCLTLLYYVNRLILSFAYYYQICLVERILYDDIDYVLN